MKEEKMHPESYAILACCCAAVIEDIRCGKETRCTEEDMWELARKIGYAHLMYKIIGEQK